MQRDALTPVMSFPYSAAIFREMSSVQRLRRRGTHGSLLTALQETPELCPHPLPSTLPLEIAQRGFLCHDLRIHSADVFTQFVQQRRLHRKLLVLRAHLAELLLSSVGFPQEILSSALQLVEILFPGAHRFHGVSDGVFMPGESCESSRKARQDGIRGIGYVLEPTLSVRSADLIGGSITYPQIISFA